MEKIDFVLTWVDGNDPSWQAEKLKFEAKTNSDSTIYRYRDWDMLEYFFRGVEKYASFVNKIYFVTWGHLPEWLNLDNPKLVIVNHKDFIPEEYLPTFSSNTIDLNLHRIKGLSDNFVLFNDDIFLLNKVKTSDFFSKNGKPLDTPALNVHCPKKSLISQYFCLNDVNIINEHFDFHKSIKNNFRKWFDVRNGNLLLRTLTLYNCPRFPGFFQHHLAASFNKNTFNTVWEKEYEILDNTCKHKFREATDVNQWVMKEWQMASGNFEVRSNKFGKSFYIDRDGIEALNKKMINYIRHQKGKMITINDGPMTEEEFLQLTSNLKKELNRLLPTKSSFEK